MTERPSEQIEDKVEIFSNTDERIKYVGKLLNSDSGMDILHLLNNNEMTANEIAKKTSMSLPLVTHHLNNMTQAGIVNIARTRLNSKNHPMKCYTASKTGILILPDLASKKAKESKSLSNSLRRIMRFSAIAVAGLTSWLITKPKPDSEIPVPPLSDGTVTDQSGDATLNLTVPDKDWPEEFFDFFWAGSNTAETLLAPLIITVAVITTGVCLNAVLSRLLMRYRTAKA